MHLLGLKRGVFVRGAHGSDIIRLYRNIKRRFLGNKSRYISLFDLDLAGFGVDTTGWIERMVTRWESIVFELKIKKIEIGEPDFLQDVIEEIWFRIPIEITQKNKFHLTKLKKCDIIKRDYFF